MPNGVRNSNAAHFCAIGRERTHDARRTSHMNARILLEFLFSSLSSRRDNDDDVNSAANLCFDACAVARACPVAYLALLLLTC